jgi:hypothetical protein
MTVPPWYDSRACVIFARGPGGLTGRLFMLAAALWLCECGSGAKPKIASGCQLNSDCHRALSVFMALAVP